MMNEYLIIFIMSDNYLMRGNYNNFQYCKLWKLN